MERRVKWEVGVRGGGEKGRDAMWEEGVKGGWV